MSKSIPIILDCDPGHDDAFAMMLAWSNPKIDLLAVTTASGNGAIDKVTMNARRIATLAKMKIPIAQGLGKPLLGDFEAAVDIHGESALDGADLPAPNMELSQLNANDLIAKIVRESTQQITLVATGPLTNIALFLKTHPELRNKISEIVFMGGSASRGNRTPYAEFNIWMDPEAADIVLRSGIKCTMLGLDVTHQALVTKSVFERISALNSNFANTLIGLLKFFAKTYDEVFEMPDPPLHDPVAIAYLIDSNTVKCRNVNVSIELSGSFTRGATVVDIYNRTGLPVNCQVALELDANKFWDLILESLTDINSKL